MRTTTGSVHGKAPTPTTPPYSPSVPLSVYRELVVELKALQARLDNLTAKNQHLSAENQILRQEITRVVQSFLHLQKLVDSSTASSYQPTSHTTTEVRNPTRQSVPDAPPRPPMTSHIPTSKKSPTPIFSVPVEEIDFPISEPVYIEEQEVEYYTTTEPEFRDFSGWWLIIMIFFIILTGFSVGYLIVRPLFAHQNR